MPDKEDHDGFVRNDTKAFTPGAETMKLNEITAEFCHEKFDGVQNLDGGYVEKKKRILRQNNS